MTDYGEGKWIDRREDGLVLGSTMRLSPVFRCEVSPETRASWSGWRCTLNGEDMGGYLLENSQRLEKLCPFLETLFRHSMARLSLRSQRL